MASEDQKLTEIFDYAQISIASILVLDVHDVTLESKLQTDLQASASDVMDILLDLESFFGIEIPDQFMEPFCDGDKSNATIGELVSTFYHQNRSQF